MSVKAITDQYLQFDGGSPTLHSNKHKLLVDEEYTCMSRKFLSQSESDLYLCKTSKTFRSCGINLEKHWLLMELRVSSPFSFRNNVCIISMKAVTKIKKKLTLLGFIT